MHKDALNDIVITGEIKNRGTSTANFVELIATFYNINNQTVGNENTFTLDDAKQVWAVLDSIGYEGEWGGSMHLESKASNENIGVSFTQPYWNAIQYAANQGGEMSYVLIDSINDFLDLIKDKSKDIKAKESA